MRAGRSDCQYDQNGAYPTPAGRPDHFGPQYIWVVRPEYQLSQLDFKVDDILGSYEDENGEKQSRNLLDNRAPIISRPDELIELFYAMALPGQDPLPGFDGDRQYVIAIGETEFLLDPDAPEPIRLAHLNWVFGVAGLTDQRRLVSCIEDARYFQ